MAVSDLNRDTREVTSGLDGIVIIKALADIPGGRTLDVTNVAAGTTVLKAGHVIISVTADGVTTYKPMPVSGSSYGSLPASHSYVGVLKASIPVKDPRAAIVTMGQVNAAASPYPLTTAMKNALSNIQFMY